MTISKQLRYPVGRFERRTVRRTDATRSGSYRDNRARRRDLSCRVREGPTPSLTRRTARRMDGCEGGAPRPGTAT